MEEFLSSDVINWTHSHSYFLNDNISPVQQSHSDCLCESFLFSLEHHSLICDHPTTREMCYTSSLCYLIPQAIRLIWRLNLYYTNYECFLMLTWETSRGDTTHTHVLTQKGSPLWTKYQSVNCSNARFGEPVFLLLGQLMGGVGEGSLIRTMGNLKAPTLLAILPPDGW